MHSALDALFHHSAGYLVGFVYIPFAVIVVCVAPAAANIFCETVFAALAREQTAFGKFRADALVKFALVHVAHKEVFIPRELVAGINIAVGHNRKIFVARAASRNLFLEANSALQIDIKVEEVKALALFVFPEISVAQSFVFV